MVPVSAPLTLRQVTRVKGNQQVIDPHVIQSIQHQGLDLPFQAGKVEVFHNPGDRSGGNLYDTILKEPLKSPVKNILRVAASKNRMKMRFPV